MKYNLHKLPLLLSIGLLLFSCFSFLFLYIKIKNTDTIATQMLEEWQTENQKSNDLKYLDRLIKSTAKEQTLLDSHFSQVSDVVPFLNMIESSARKTGANSEVTSVNVLEGGKVLSLQIKATGSFESVYKFLMLLENSPYELEFSSVDFQQVFDNSAINNQKTRIPQWSAVFVARLLTFLQ